MQETGDVAGTVATAGGLQAKCSDNYWWLAPGCRSASPTCIPLLFREPEGISSVMLLATAYGMPLGVARVKSLEAFVRLVAEKNVLFYWWYPDNTFNDLQPQQVFLPSIREEVFAGKSVSTNLKVPWNAPGDSSGRWNFPHFFGRVPTRVAARGGGSLGV